MPTLPSSLIHNGVVSPESCTANMAVVISSSIALVGILVIFCKNVVGADIEEISAFVEHYGVFSEAPPFTQVTMRHIEQGVHCAAASFTFGRETVIPAMFKRILRQLNINDYDAPKFHYYLERHIEVDGDEHGPLAEKMVNYFCEDNPRLIHEAEVAAIEAIKARIELFDTIEEDILNNK